MYSCKYSLSCIQNKKGSLSKLITSLSSKYNLFGLIEKSKFNRIFGAVEFCLKGLESTQRDKANLVEKAVSGVAADMMINPQVGAMDFAGANGSSFSSSDTGTNIAHAIRDAVSGMNGQSGDIVIPIYLGGTMLDEVIINAGQRTNLRSGGR